MPEAAQPEMLWESSDPISELERRFGFPTADAAVEWVTRLLARDYDLQVVGLDRCVISFHNLMLWVRSETAGRVIVKICRLADAHPALTARAGMVSWLAGRRHPVARPVRTTARDLQIIRDGHSVGVQPVLVGDLLDPADHSAVRAAGGALAALHHDLAVWPGTDQLASDRSAPADAELLELPERVTDLPADLRRLFERRTGDLLPLPPAQPIHGDYRGANILCRHGGITGVLDFEDARIGAAVDDLARAVCLLGTWFHDWRPLRPEAEAAFLKGYQDGRTLTEAEGQWLSPLVARTMLGLGWWDDARRWLE